MLSLELHESRFRASWEAEKENRAKISQDGEVWDTFQRIQIIGTGAFGAVALCKRTQTPDKDKVKLKALGTVFDL